MEAISPVTKLANDVYRKTSGHSSVVSLQMNGRTHGSDRDNPGSVPQPGSKAFTAVVDALLIMADLRERKVIRRVASRLNRGRTGNARLRAALA